MAASAARVCPRLQDRHPAGEQRPTPNGATGDAPNTAPLLRHGMMGGGLTDAWQGVPHAEGDSVQRRH